MSEAPRMDIAEFRAQGFLQEANRLFFHPLGLALFVEVDDDGNETLGGVYDSRDDDEGFCFAEAAWTGGEDEKAKHVADEFLRHLPERVRLFGGPIQQIGQGFSD
jgi:hypothetical protein